MSSAPYSDRSVAIISTNSGLAALRCPPAISNEGFGRRQIREVTVHMELHIVL